MSFFLAVVEFCLTVQSVEAKQIKFCPKALTSFMDRGGPDKEDILNNYGYFKTKIPFAYIRLTKKTQPETVLWDEYLNEDGCTDHVELENNTDYEVVMQARLGTDNGRTIHLPKDGDQECGYWCERPYFEWADTFRIRDNIETLRGDTWNGWEPSYSGPRIQLMLIAGLMLARYDDLAYPANTKTIIKIDGQSDCGHPYGGVSNYGTQGQICSTSTNTDRKNRHVATDASYYKFATAHELGHRIQFANNVGGASDIYSFKLDTDDNTWKDDTRIPNNSDNNTSMQSYR